MPNKRVLRPFSTLALLTAHRLRNILRVRLFALSTLVVAALRSLVSAAQRIPRWMLLSNGGADGFKDKKLRSLKATGRAA